MGAARKTLASGPTGLRRAWGSGRLTACFVVFNALFGAASSAFADPENDGAYGRLEGDLALHAGSGVGIVHGGPHLAFQLEALYLDTAGFYARYTDSLGQHTDIKRTLSTGVEVRPLFLARYASDLERGPARLDLFLDSLSIEMGVVWDQAARGSFARRPGLEVGTGLEFPLLAKASGPYIGAFAALRLQDPSEPNDRDVLQQGSMLLFTFSWHQIVPAHLVDFGDKSSR